MAQSKLLITHLKPGNIYRRKELTQWSTAIDRHLSILVAEGTLQKIWRGVYYYPRNSAFGKVPPDETKLVRSFLKDDRFLITSPNAYNGLGVGATQLYNKTTVYNHKRHGKFTLGNRTFYFQVKTHFPTTLSKEFLLIDLVNNLDRLAEDPGEILKNVADKITNMNQKKLSEFVREYGSIKTKKIFSAMLNRK